MNSNQRANQKAIEKYRKELEAMVGEIRTIDEKILNRAMNEGLKQVKQLTPAGVYKNRTGGTLRRNWSRTRVFKTQTYVTATLYNNTGYALYVNYGHRVVNKNGETIGWVNGKFMLEKSLYRIEKTLEREFRKEIERINKQYD